MKCKKCGNEERIIKAGSCKCWSGDKAFYRKQVRCYNCGHKWRVGDREYVEIIDYFERERVRNEMQKM
jgi:hypothetical protein